MTVIYFCLGLLCLLVGLALYYAFQIFFIVKEKNRLNEELIQQLSGQVFQSFDSLKNSLHQVEQNTKNSLVDSLEKSGRQSTQMILEHQNRNHHLLGELSGKLHHLGKWQNDINDLNHRIHKLGKILDNTNLKGKFGELQLEVLLKNILPPSWIKEQHSLPNGTRVDFMIDTSKHTLCLCIDSKFPVQSYRLLIENPENKQYLKEFFQVIKKNIQDISEKYIIPTLTLDFALLFVPSESIFSQILMFDDLMDFAQKKKVLLCSPQTLHWQLVLMKKMVIELGIDDFIESKGHLVHEIAQENEKILNKVHLIEKKTLHIQRDIKYIESAVQKHMKFMESLLDSSYDQETENELPISQVEVED